MKLLCGAGRSVTLLTAGLLPKLPTKMPRLNSKSAAATFWLGNDWNWLPETIERSSPHRLCSYLYELASDFTAFYEHCPVLKAPDASTRASRLALSDVTARVLARGLHLLGIDAPEQM